MTRPAEHVDSGEDTLNSDIAFLRALASDPGHALRRDGAILLAAGIIFASVSAGYWLRFSGAFGAPERWGDWLWIAGVVAFVVATGAIERAMPRTPSPSARAVHAAMTSVGIGNVVSAAALFLGGWQLGLPSLAAWAFPIVLFALYGSAWSVAFAVRRRAWFAFVAGGCFTVALALGGVMGTPTAWLVLALGLIVLVALPGLIMLRQPMTS